MPAKRVSKPRRNGAQVIQFPDDLLSRKANDPQVAHIVEGERKLFTLRSEARNGEKAQLRERTAQLEERSMDLASKSRLRARRSL